MLDDLAIREREVREASGIRCAKRLEVMTNDHDARLRRDRRNLRTQAVLQEAATAACHLQQRKPTFGKKNALSPDEKSSLHVVPKTSLFDEPPRSGLKPNDRASVHSFTLPLMSNESFAPLST